MTPRTNILVVFALKQCLTEAALVGLTFSHSDHTHRNLP